MTVLVAKTPQSRYQSIGGTGSTTAEREKADQLDKILEKRMGELVIELTYSKLMPEAKGKGSLLTYWTLGKALLDVASHTELFREAELPLLWRATNGMYLPDQLKYAERGPYREHLWYCFRLASYPKILAEKMYWGEWVTIFDSSGINQEPRFDNWFQEKLKFVKGRVSREQIRVFVPCVNEMLCNIHIPDLTQDELFYCYEAAWQIMEHWQIKSRVKKYRVGRTDLQKAIEMELGKLDAVMSGEVGPIDYAIMILKKAEQ